MKHRNYMQKRLRQSMKPVLYPPRLGKQRFGLTSLEVFASATILMSLIAIKMTAITMVRRMMVNNVGNHADQQ